MKFFKKKLKGFGLTELILAIGIFATISSVLLLLVVDSKRTLENGRYRTRAANLVEEINSSLLMIKSNSWFSLARYTEGGEKHFELIDGEYVIVDGQGESNGMTYSFSVGYAYRDAGGNLVLEGGSADPHTRLISLNIEWRDFLGRVHSIAPVIFLNDWDTNSVVYTTLEDFLLGEHSSTLAVDTLGGEVRLQSMFYADWCNPSLSMSSYDLPGQGIASNVSTYEGTVYMGTGENASGISFMKALVSGDPPILTNSGTYEGYKVNDIYGVNGMALLATDTNAEEVVILDVENYPYTKTGSFDSAGPADADAIYALNNLGFVGHGSTLSVFDLSSYSGSRPLIRSISVSGTVTDIYVDEQYAYLTLSGGTNEFEVYQYSPSLVRKGYVDLGSQSATSMFISEDKNRAYVGTTVNSGPEFFILDISNKDGIYPVVSSYEAGALSITGVAFVDNRAILVGSGGEEYTVLDITDENTPARCGGLNIDTGVNALTLVKEGLKYYTYVVTKDSSSEFKIIQGGPGGGGADGHGYLPSGLYNSAIFDSQSEQSSYYIVSLQATIPEGTSLKIQFRASNISNMSDATWLGPDGTSLTYYESDGIFELPSTLSGRYLQYRAFFESDTVSTPLLEEIVINYEK